MYELDEAYHSENGRVLRLTIVMFILSLRSPIHLEAPTGELPSVVIYIELIVVGSIQITETKREDPSINYETT